MKDDGFADENVGWTRIITKTVFRVSDQIRTNMAVHCIAVMRKVNGLKFRICKVKGLNYLCCKTNVLTSYAETTYM